MVIIGSMILIIFVLTQSIKAYGNFWIREKGMYKETSNLFYHQPFVNILLTCIDSPTSICVYLNQHTLILNFL